MNNNENAERLLIEMIKSKEQHDKNLLLLEIVIGVMSILFYFAIAAFTVVSPLKPWINVIIMICGLIICIFGCLVALKIEQIAGYYECQKCGNRYVPKFLSVILAPHINRTRYMKCPKCEKKSWQKKVISKE